MTYIGKNSALLQKKKWVENSGKIIPFFTNKGELKFYAVNNNNLKMRYDVWEEDFEESVTKKAI